MEIAATRGCSEVLKILSEEISEEISDKVKLIQMSLLMSSDKPRRSKEKFQSMLESLPVDLVRTFVGAYFQFLCHQVSGTKANEEGTLLQKAMYNLNKDFAEILLDFG